VTVDRRGSEPIGLIGVGRMGLPVCANLVRAGYRVLASDRRPEQADKVRALGAIWEPETRAAAASAEVLITMLPGSDELRSVMNVATPALRPGTTWIDVTSSSPVVGRELRERACERGVQCLDAPVGGGVEAATAGTLQLFVGGQIETVDRLRGLLEALGSVNHVGASGAGYTTKLLVNLLWFGQALATAEALLVARRAGLDLDVLRDALGHSAADSEFIRRDLGALLDGDYLESFGLDRCCEELEAVMALAGELGVPCELSATVTQGYLRALERYGPVDGELLAVALLEERAGIRLRHESR
jgi:3-hydroxyisobutyrate dehydrogenase